MTTSLLRPALLARALVVAALGASSLAAASAAHAEPADDVVCATTPMSRPMPLSAALDSGISALWVRTVNLLTGAELDQWAEDETSWLDKCGKVYVVDEAATGQQKVVADAAPATVPSDVFDLSSRPGSSRTIYLDFDGSTYSNTRWKRNEDIVSPAYSIDADATTFNEAERAQIFLAWQVVAEDYAPFDVNVTTRQPAASALTRTNAADQTYGMPVVITPTNSVGSSCGCGGQAYVGTFGSVNANDAQPAWIYTNGSGTGGYNMGQVISHEVGHTFGLSHDGTSHTSYYTGDKGWAPIMGASYGKRASQWSKGEYADASNKEDDVAIIAKTAPVIADDHESTAAKATKVAVGATTTGVITSRADTDAFSFTTSGPTTITVAGPAGHSNVDVEATLYDALGNRIGTIDPVADLASDESMAATWSAELPSPPASYTLVVDGTGNGDPLAVGRYSDYGSLGAYAVTVSTTPPAAEQPTPTTTPTPTTPTTPTTGSNDNLSSQSATSARQHLSFVTRTLPKARAGKKYRAEIRFSGPVSEALVDWRLPQGLKWRVLADRIVITGKVKKATVARFSAELNDDDVTVKQRFRLVVR